MTDAELMTTAPDVPGLEVKETITKYTPLHGLVTAYEVILNETLIGKVFKSSTQIKSERYKSFYGRVEDLNYSRFSTRNAAVQWILDQHKKVTNNA